MDLVWNLTLCFTGARIWHFRFTRRKRTNQLSLLLIKKNGPISGWTDICKYNHIFIHTSSSDQRKNPETTKMLFPNIWLLIPACDWIISIPPRNKSQAFNLFNLVNINCHSEYKISLLLNSKRKHQREDKWLGEKYHLAEAWSSQASPTNDGNNERKENTSQETIVFHPHNTSILLDFFFTLLVLARQVTNIASVMRTPRGNDITLLNLPPVSSKESKVSCTLKRKSSDLVWNESSFQHKQN